jgi:hypothetical protein
LSLDLPELHDATLVAIRFDWEQGVAALTLRTSRRGEATLHMTDCTELVVPRHEEWGRSVSVLAANYVDDDPNAGLVIEMQSGDRIVLRGRVGEWVVGV